MSTASESPKRRQGCRRSQGQPSTLPATNPSSQPASSLTPSFPLSKEAGRIVTNVEAPDPHLGWYSRGYLPHWDHPSMIQSINFRLADSLPRNVVERCQNELALTSQPEPERAIEL